MPKTNTANQDQNLPAWATMSEVARYLNVSERSTRRLIASGDLQARRIGKRLLRVDRASVLALLGVTA